MHKWNLPDKSLSVIGQCKKYTKPIGTNYLQQFDGTMSRLSTPTSSNNSSILGVLVSSSGFSKAAAAYFMNGVSFFFFPPKCTHNLITYSPLCLLGGGEESFRVSGGSNEF